MRTMADIDAPGILFSPDGARLRPGAGSEKDLRIIVRGGRMRIFRPDEGEAPPLGIREYKGGYIAPPLFDSHVHLFLDGFFDRERRDRIAALDGEEALNRALGLLEKYRRLGIAVVRDGGDPKGLALAAARLANADPARYSAVLASGEPIHRKGRYGGFLGAGVENVREAVALLHRNKEAGASQAKILATGVNSLDKAGDYGGLQFTIQELSQIFKAARTLKMSIMVHANGPCGRIAGLGPDSIEHGFWMEEGDLEALASENVVWTPTLTAWASLHHDPAMGPSKRAVIAETDSRQRMMVERAFRAGVRLAAGSDSGTPGVRHAEGLFDEISRLSSSGLGMECALAAACARDDLDGGAEGGFVRYEEDPVLSPSTMKRPLGVFLGGVYTDMEKDV